MMQMTNFEIWQDYRLAKHPQRQIQILAQRNLCSSNDIISILERCGETVPYRRNSSLRKTKEQIRMQYEKRLALYQKGLTDHEIADKLNEAYNTVSHWRLRQGLPPNKQQAKVI